MNSAATRSRSRRDGQPNDSACGVGENPPLPPPSSGRVYSAADGVNRRKICPVSGKNLVRSGEDVYRQTRLRTGPAAPCLSRAAMR